MIVKDKEKFYKRLFIYRYLKFLNFESDIKDSILAGTAYFDSIPRYDDFEEVNFDDFCDPFF